MNNKTKLIISVAVRVFQIILGAAGIGLTAEVMQGFEGNAVNLYMATGIITFIYSIIQVIVQSPLASVVCIGIMNFALFALWISCMGTYAAAFGILNCDYYGDYTTSYYYWNFDYSYLIAPCKVGQGAIAVAAVAAISYIVSFVLLMTQTVIALKTYEGDKLIRGGLFLDHNGVLKAEIKPVVSVSNVNGANRDSEVAANSTAAPTVPMVTSDSDSPVEKELNVAGAGSGTVSGSISGSVSGTNTTSPSDSIQHAAKNV